MTTGSQEPERKKTILVVDDTPENLDVMKGLLSPFYRVQIATNGRLALKIATAPVKPDLILLDVMMPDMDGYEACRLLKLDERTQGIPVLFVTAKSDVEDETRGLELGAEDYLTKPISPPILLARVKTHLAMSDRRQMLADEVRMRTLQLQLRNEELDATRIEVINQLGRAGEYRDNETGMHVMRMSRFTRLLALRSGVMTNPEADQLMLAVSMHDIGKIGIPDRVLLKPGRLTDDELAIMQTHTVIGHEIIGQQSAEVLHLGGVIAYTHHEKWNGTGYPRGLKQEEIPLVSRLAAIGDVFDALTSARPYKPPWRVEDALAMIASEAGEHFEPRLARIFVQMQPELIAVMEQYQG